MAEEESQELHELSVTRHIAASPEAVWEAMLDRLTEWWCPKPWTTEIKNVEWRAGGPFQLVMRGPEGEEMSGAAGVLLEVTPERRFVFTDALSHDWRPCEAFMVGSFELAPEGDGTRYTASARHWNAADMKRHEEMGFTDGWGAVADQLAALVEGD